MWLPVLGLLVGILLGLLRPVEIPLGYVKYTAIAILAAIDTILGGVRARLEARFDLGIFLSGFLINAAFAALLAGLGDLLGLDLYLGAVIAFSIRIFDNVGFIRRGLLDAYIGRRKSDAQRDGVAGVRRVEG
ncbi:MAG: small basic family protein [Armatimonadetes bacterium]|nr:small basic family protein [Armatimonadota bacterium]